MEDEKLKELFSDFRPDLSPDSCFMSKLQDSLDKVELVKQHNIELKSRNKKAVMAAALAGFISGVFFTLLLPYTDSFAQRFEISMPHFGSNTAFLSYDCLKWIIGAFLSVASALTAYDIATARLKHNHAGI